MTLYKGNKVIAGSRSYIGNIGDIKYTARVDLPFGGSWCDGSIKLKAQFPTVYQMLIDGKLQALDIATYESALNLNGSCGFFGLDTATESFRVPSLNDVYIKSGQVADEFGAESLPNITGSVYSERSESTGAFYNIGGKIKDGASNNDSATSEEILLDASRISSAYQDGAKVNPDHVKYRAYVVLYTGADTNVDITKEIQLNNPFSFGMSQWLESDPKNASWLLSDGAFHSGAIYESFYNWLLSEYNNPDMLPNNVNADIVGNLEINNWVVSGFSDNNYCVCKTIPSNITNLEMCAKVRVGNSTSNTIEAIYGNSKTNRHTPQLTIDSGVFWFGLSGDGNAWTSVKSTLTPTRNKDYWLKGTWDGSRMELLVSEDGVVYTSLGTSALTSLVWDEFLIIGDDATSSNWWNGLIYMEDTYIKVNGNMWWKGIDNVVRKTTESYSDYDYIIDTESNSFRLPVKTHLASGNAVAGNGNPVYLTANQTGRSDYPITNSTSVGVNISTNISNANGDTLGITTDPTKSGIETSPNGLKLYFYVGETVQDANLINASKVLDLLAKLESYDYVVESKIATASDPTWYRVYKSGWVEQGGKILHSSSDTTKTIEFPKEFSTTDYTFIRTARTVSGSDCYPCYVTGGSSTYTTKTMKVYLEASSRFVSSDWEAKGQGA
jgi:hypothetical protein